MNLPVYCPTCALIVFVDAAPGEACACAGCNKPLRIPAAEDVFVSFSFRNLAEAQQVTAKLLGAGVRAWLATDRTGTGDDFLEAIAGALGAARVYLLLLSRESASSRWVRRELIDAATRGLPMLAIKLEEVEMPPWMRVGLGGAIWEDAFDRPFEQRLDGLVADVQRKLRAGAAEAVATASEAQRDPAKALPLKGVIHAECPYIGPVPFSSHEGGKFFGRDDEARHLLTRLADSRIVLLYAPSGAGKSSLLNTAVRQSLEESGLEVLRSTRVGVSVPAWLGARAGEIANVFSFSAVSGLRGDTLPDVRSTLAGYLSGLPPRRGARGRVLVIDQFEELFTQHLGRHEDRAGFMEDLRAALEAQPGLRVILAMRQEYLANLDEHAERLPPELRPARVWLRRLEGRGALEAITRPAERYAEFANDVGEEIVRQLSMMKVAQPDGSVVKKRGEFIELVHLQIVCRRLWSRLPEGITRIEPEHLQLAAGPGQRFDDFVENALVEFYDETVREAAISAVDPVGSPGERRGFPEELIRLGCMKFVNAAGIRLTIQQDRRSGRTGRLPNWVVDELERRHLLRAEQRGGERWYELSHDLLAETVGRGRDRKVTELLAATDLLETLLGRARTEGDRHLAGYFRPHQELLSECAPFRSQPGLFEDESAFLFRASLVSGHDAAAWSARLARDDPGGRVSVLTEALAAADRGVRANAAALLAADPVQELLPRLAELAVGDPEEAVRRAAAQSLAHLNRPELFATLADRLEDPAQHAAAARALAVVINERDLRGVGLEIQQVWDRLPARRRGGIRREARGLRLREGWVVLPYVVVPAAILSAAGAGLFKFLPGIPGWALAQATPSFIGGLFMGATAGLIWGVTLPLSITLYWLVYASKVPKGSMFRPFGALLFGGAAGLVTGLLVVLSVVGVFEIPNLVEIGWLDDKTHTPSKAAFWLDLFVRTRFGWAYAITGIGLGIAMAMTANSLRAVGAFNDLKGGEGAVGDFRQIGRLIRRATPRVLKKAWPIPVLQVLTGVLAFGLLRPGVHALRPPGMGPAEEVEAGRAKNATRLVSKWTFEGRLLGLFVDSGSEAVGGTAAVIGMGVGLIIMSRGVQVNPRRDLS